MAEAGKGSRPRPYSVDKKTFDSNWDTVFRKQEQSVTYSRRNSSRNRKQNYRSLG